MSATPSVPASGTFAFSQEDTGPENTLEQQAFRRIINEVYDAIPEDVPAPKREEAVNNLRTAMPSFKGVDHSNPDWAVENALGNAKYALFAAGNGTDQGLFHEALTHQENSAKLAKNNTQVAKSMNNLCDFYRRAGRTRDAIAAGLTAHELWPSNEGAIVNLSLALYSAGQKKDANKILQKLLDATGIHGSIVGAHAQFEADLIQMKDLEVVQILLGRVGDGL